MPPGSVWFAVRHVVKNSEAYEERVTLWDARCFEDAHALARAEADGYANDLGDGRLLDLFQVYWLFEDPVWDSDLPPGSEVTIVVPSGTEVFSLVRESDLEPSEYLESFLDTGFELESHRVRIFGSAFGRASDTATDG